MHIKLLMLHVLCRPIQTTVYIIKIGSVCLCHGQHAIGDRRYFLAPCDNRPPATPARILLGDTLCGYLATAQ